MTHYQLVASNKRRSWLVIIGFLGVLALVFSFFAYLVDSSTESLILASLVSLLVTFFSYWQADHLVLSLTGAKPASRDEFFDFYTLSENLAHSQGLPTPALFVLEDPSLNAFATGRDPKHASLVATTGLLSTLTRAELEGVIGHELSHIKNYDVRLMTLITIMIGFLTLLADWFWRWSWWGQGRKSDNREEGQLKLLLGLAGIILIALSPLIANLIKLALSRRREFLADAGAVAITKNPQGLISALEKLAGNRAPLHNASHASAHLFITNPFLASSQTQAWFNRLFDTHPPLAERIRALEAITR